MAAQRLKATFITALVTLVNSTCAASATPLVCTTTYNNTGVGTVLESSVCKSIESQNERLGEEIYTWRAPYSSGIGLFQGIAEDLGLAFGGINGTHIVGFGYPEQTIGWDGGILQKSVKELLELQAEALPLRTADLTNAFESSLANASFEETIPNLTKSYKSPMGAHPLW